MQDLDKPYVTNLSIPLPLRCVNPAPVRLCEVEFEMATCVDEAASAMVTWSRNNSASAYDLEGFASEIPAHSLQGDGEAIWGTMSCVSLALPRVEVEAR